MATKKIIIQETEHIQLRICVAVRYDQSDQVWSVRWLDRGSNHLTKSGAIAAAREQCKALMASGVLSELVLYTKAGRIQDRRTYGADPRRSAG